MREIAGVKTVKITAMIPLSEERALKQMAKDNNRSMAAQIRVGLHDMLKSDGRVT